MRRFKTRSNTNGASPKAPSIIINSFSRFTTPHMLVISFVLIFASIGTYSLLSSHASSSLTADFNTDGTVNILDLSILASNWGKTNTTVAMGDANSDNTVNINDLSILASQWGQVATPAPTPTPTNTYNVVDYGAKGDGATNDQPSIQAAINAAFNSGGGIVYLPSGTYYLNNTGYVIANGGMRVGVELKNNVKMVGDGIGKTFVKSAGSGMNSIGAWLADNIGVESLSLSGGPQDGLKFAKSNNVSIKYVEAYSHYIGFACYGCTNVLTAYSIAHDNSGMGFAYGDNTGGMTGGYNQTWTNDEAYNNSEGFRVFSKDNSVPVGSVTANNLYSHNNTTGILVTVAKNLTVNGGKFNNNPNAGLLIIATSDSLISGVEAIGNGGYGNIKLGEYPTSEWWNVYGHPNVNIVVN